MNTKQELAAYLILLCGIICIGLIPIDSKHSEKINYCHVDSIAKVNSGLIFIPEYTNKCWTDCGYIFFTKKEYSIGDSIQIKTIIIE